MLNRFFKSLAVYLFFMFMVFGYTMLQPYHAFAQKCDAPYETITRLHHPDPGAFMVWNSVFGEQEHKTKFISAIASLRNNRNVIAAGEIRAASGIRPALLLVEFDRRGRKIWSKVHNIPYLDQVIKVASNGDGYVLIANISPPKKHRAIWLGFFDGMGKFKSYKKLSDNKFDLFANDMQPKIGSAGWVVPVTAIIKHADGGGDQKNASVFLLDSKGNQISSRSYILGLKTEIIDLSVSNFGDGVEGYIATGYFENNSGKKIGWVVRLNSDLSMVWQKEFSRGVSAKLVASYPSGDGNVLVAGNVESSNLKSGGAWLAKLDDVGGAIIWQRYYMSGKQTHTYSVRDINVNKDGLIALLMMADPVDVDAKGNNIKDDGKSSKMSGFGVSDDSSYGHLLTLTPRGITLSGDAFYYGSDVMLYSLSQDENGRRIIAGSSMVKRETVIKDNEVDNEGAIVPLRDNTDVHLPDALLSDKTKKGLALLKKKIEAQSLISQNGEDKLHNDSAKLENTDRDLVQKGWVVVGDMPDAYIDPCK